MIRRQSARERRRPIVLVTSSPAPFHPRHYYLMACALHEAGLPVVVMAQPHRGSHPEGPVPVIQLPSSGGRLMRMLSGPRIVWRLARMRPGVIQVNCLDLLPWAVVARLLLRVPVAYDSNEDYAAYMLIKEWLPRRARAPLAWLVGRLEPALAARLDAVVTADEGTARKFRPSARRVCVLFNFPRGEMAAAELAEAGSVSDVMYHGTLHGYYRDHIIEAARRLDRRGVPARWCLAVRGAGPAEQRDIEGRLSEAGLRQRFTLLFDVPFTRIPALVAGTRVGFIPLPDEIKYRVNLPRKLFEFMAAGRPTVVSDLPPIRDLVGEARCCALVPPGDDDGYVEALEDLLTDSERAARLGRRGRRLVEESLNAEAAVAPYVDLIEALRGR